LKTQGLLTKEEEIVQNVSTAERTGGVIEPLPKLQWFVDVNKTFLIEKSEINGIPSGSQVSPKELMGAAVANGQIKILPERFEKIYFHWVNNLRDWCISRQIWFGHQIPVWYRNDEIFCDIEPPQGEGWIQDPDTLDTWFSSGMWTFSTLGWPEQTKDLEVYHPTSVLETGYDILFFWVARMILMTTCLLGTIPFRTVYLHGLVRDAKGRKMSKSLGNGIDPLEMADKYGADGTRMSLIIGAAPGNDIRLSEDKIRGYRNFANKIWNAARFVMMNKPGEESHFEFSEAQKAHIAGFENIKAEITAHIEKYEFHMAAELAYHYFWHTFADKIIEEQKESLRSEDPGKKQAAFETLKTILDGSLKMLHPFMPFVTEAIYGLLYPGRLLMVEKW
jgi:valyl-tRNA synthetase